MKGHVIPFDRCDEAYIDSVLRDICREFQPILEKEGILSTDAAYEAILKRLFKSEEEQK